MKRLSIGKIRGLQYLSRVGADRLKRLTEITGRCAVPWYNKFGLAAHELAYTSEKWYKEY